MARVRVEVPVENTPIQPAQVQPQNPVEPNTNQPNQPLRKKLIIIALTVVAIIFVINLINDKNKLEQQLSTKQDGGTQQVNEIVSLLAKTIELPIDETPVVRTLIDSEVAKLAQQNPAFDDIKSGDTLLLFEKSLKIVVYRPSTKKAVIVVKFVPPSSDSTPQPSSIKN